MTVRLARKTIDARSEQTAVLSVSSIQSAHIIPAVLALLAGIGVWELLAHLFRFEFFPPFSAVVQAWWQIYQTGELLSEIATSLRALFIGYMLAVVIGLSVGILMGRFRRLEYFLEPLIDINLATPALVFIPFLFVLFGIGDETRYAIVFMYAVFIIIVNTVSGIRTADRNLIEMAVSFGASERQVFTKVVGRCAQPLILAGLRIGMSRAVKGMINGELFIALVGLGARLRSYGGSFQIDKAMAILLTIIVIALLTTGLLHWLSRLLKYQDHSVG